MDGSRITKDRAKALRRTLSLPEVLLWKALKGRAVDGLHFRKQHPIGPYILDFYCEAAKLAVEVDGASHGAGDRPVRDERRDAWLAGAGDRYASAAGVADPAGCG
jgi:very-short-patch-repair endonuclease